MSEEEFFNRMINQISKVFDGRIATEMKNIYLKKDEQLNKQKEVIDKIKEYLNKVKLGELENGKPYTFKDFLKEEKEAENEEAKWLLKLLEKIN